MKKKIGILGSTGSIGENTVKIIQNNKKDFDVIFLSTNINIAKLLKQPLVYHCEGLLQIAQQSYKLHSSRH